MRQIGLLEAKQLKEKTESVLDKIGTVELKEIFFDSIAWIRPKAILIKKGKQQCWVARSVIVSINNTEVNATEPSSIEVYSWVDLEWQPISKKVK